MSDLFFVFFPEEDQDEADATTLWRISGASVSVIMADNHWSISESVVCHVDFRCNLQFNMISHAERGLCGQRTNRRRLSLLSHPGSTFFTYI